MEALTPFQLELLMLLLLLRPLLSIVLSLV